MFFVVRHSPSLCNGHVCVIEPVAADNVSLAGLSRERSPKIVNPVDVILKQADVPGVGATRDASGPHRRPSRQYAIAAELPVCRPLESRGHVDRKTGGPACDPGQIPPANNCVEAFADRVSEMTAMPER